MAAKLKDSGVGKKTVPESHHLKYYRATLCAVLTINTIL